MDLYPIFTLFLNYDSSLGVPTVNHHILRVYPASEKSCTTRQRVNNIPTQKETFQHKKQGIAASVEYYSP